MARSTAPGLGYGRCWNSGPDAVESTPDLTSRSRPADHEPLRDGQRRSAVGEGKPWTGEHPTYLNREFGTWWVRAYNWPIMY